MGSTGSSQRHLSNRDTPDLPPRTGTAFLATWTPPSHGPTGRHTSSRAPSIGGSLTLVRWMLAIPSSWIRVSAGYQITWTRLLFGQSTIKFTFSKDRSTGNLTQTSHHQWTHPTQDPSPTGTEYQKNLTPPCNTVTGSLISSRMVVTIVSTTKTLCSTLLPTHRSPERPDSGGSVARQTASDSPSCPKMSVGQMRPCLSKC